MRVIERAVARSGRSVGPRVLSRQPADGRVVDLSDRPDCDSNASTMRRQWTLFGYVTKTPTVSYQPKAGARAETGWIVGKRAGFSHHLLGAVPWKRFANDHGRPDSWIRDFLKTTAQPFPLSYGVYTAPLWCAEPPTEVSAPREGPDAYPKTPDVTVAGLNALKAPKSRM